MSELKKCIWVNNPDIGERRVRMSADLVIINSNVITVDNNFSIQEAIAVKNGMIDVLGTNDMIEAFMGPKTQVIDLKGKTILPGINESHMHAAFFGSTRPPIAIDLTAAAVQSIPDMCDALSEKVSMTAPGVWIRGFGWEQGFLEECKKNPGRLPRKWDLDSVSPDHPVAFSDFSGHTLLVNSKALELAGITKETPDPESGEMERDSDGEPTGIFKEIGAQALVTNKIPLLTREEKKIAVQTALKHLNANGVTSYTDAAIGPGGENFANGVMSAEFFDLYQELLAEGQLPARVTVLLLLGDYGGLTYQDLETGLKTIKLPSDLDSQWLQFPGVKLFADGVPMTYTSWMNDDYVGSDLGHGRSVLPGKTDEEQRDNLIRMIKLIHESGYQIGIHATGDRAIDAAVDGFILALKASPGREPRHYIIHGDFISPEKIHALAQYNCGISMQPYIKAMISDFEPMVVGETRAAYQWPTRKVLDAGIKLTCNSDAPVTYPNWRLGIQAAVLREGLSSGKASGPEECITVEEAIRAYTINGAWQDHMEKIKGSIEVGKVADLCVIGEDILNIDPHEIGKISVLMTIVGGKIVYDATSQC